MSASGRRSTEPGVHSFREFYTSASRRLWADSQGENGARLIARRTIGVQLATPEVDALTFMKQNLLARNGEVQRPAHDVNKLFAWVRSRFRRVVNFNVGW